MHYIGLDIHKRETEACVLTARGRVVERKRFRTTRAAFRRELEDYPESRVVIEAVGIHRPVAGWLDELGHEVHVAHPRNIPPPAVKTDKKDARHLANLLRSKILPEAWLAPENVQVLRDLARHRQFLGDEERRLKSKIKHDLYKHGHFVDENPANTKAGRHWLKTRGVPEVTSALNLLESVEEELNAFEDRIANVTTDDPVARRLMTIPGVGPFMALVVVAEVGDFHRFPTGDHLASYGGFKIVQRQSGDRDWRGSLAPDGNPLLNWAMVQVARNHVRHCPDSSISQRYERLRRKKKAGSAMVATARVLLTMMHSMVVNERDFTVNPPSSGRLSAH